MGDPSDLHDWELIHNSSSSDSDDGTAFEQILRSDYFAIDRKSGRFGDSLGEIGLGGDKGSSFTASGSEFGGENEKGTAFVGSDSEMDGGFGGGSEKGESFVVSEPEMEVDPKVVEDPTEFGFKGVDGSNLERSMIRKEDSSTAQEYDGLPSGESEMEMGLEVTDGDRIELEVREAEGTEGHSSEIIPAGEGVKKEMVWWKLPVELLKFYVFRMRPIWSIPIAAAVIGIVMMGRKLYRMKYKSRKVPLKISFEDKKAAAHLLVRAARLNEAVIRRVPVVRSPLLPASGMTPWPLVGLL